MPGQALRLGPFIGGLNLASDPTAIADAELVESLNLELDIDGSMISRPAFQELDGHASWTERIVCIGEAIFGSDYYLIGSNSTGVYYYLNGTWTLITATVQSYVAVQYGGFLYIVPEPSAANPGGKWTPGGGFSAVAAIPQGMAAVVHKERLFIAPGINASTNESRLKFSDAGNLDSWPAGNFIDIGQGDGTKLIDVTVYQDNLMLFKNKSTYLLAYDVRPSDAVSRRVSSTIGVDRQFCMVNYENQVYVQHGGWVYEIINYDFARINTKVPFERDETAPTPFADEKIFVSIVGDRLICRYFKKVYTYGLRTRTWSEWEASDNVLQYFGPVFTMHYPTGLRYFSGSSLSNYTTIVELFDKRDTTTKEQVLTPTITITDDFNETVAAGGWGTSDQGVAWTVNEGTASYFSKNGTKGVVSVNSVNTTQTISLDTNTADADVTDEFVCPVTPTGSSIIVSTRVRQQAANTYYRIRCEYTTTSTLSCTLQKVVAGAGTTLAGPFTITGLIAGETFKCRIQIVDTAIKAKVWRNTVPEPGTWNLTATDGAITGSGDIAFSTILTAGNTNTLPVAITADNLQMGAPSAVTRDITCRAKTKNFDMAISHQFKRLWWWGLDASTSRVVVGTATPLVVSFDVLWSQLESLTWGDLADNTWGQPLTAPLGVGTTVTPSAGTSLARRFIKFNKGLRYRQINFEVQMLTNGTTTDGPVRMFSMTIHTESKQTVSKSVS